MRLFYVDKETRRLCFARLETSIDKYYEFNHRCLKSIKFKCVECILSSFQKETFRSVNSIFIHIQYLNN